MANKHVINPCENSGKFEGLEEVRADVESIAPDNKGVLKTKCPVCGNEATVNKKTMVFRKHSQDKK